MSKTNFKKNNNNKKAKTSQRIDIPDIHAGIFEYKMTSTLANSLLKQNKGTRPPQEVLCEFVNTFYGLKGYCVRVIVDL
jgi:hypothetical protein